MTRDKGEKKMHGFLLVAPRHSDQWLNVMPLWQQLVECLKATRMPALLIGVTLEKVFNLSLEKELDSYWYYISRKMFSSG